MGHLSIYVDKSSLLLKYFHRFGIVFEQKIYFKNFGRVKIIKDLAGSILQIGSSGYNQLRYAVKYHFWKENFYRKYLILLFIS